MWRKNLCPSSDETGGAIVEFLALTLLMLIPIVYLIIAINQIQAAKYAVESAAREAARSFTTAETDDEAHARAAASVQLALSDQGFDEDHVGDILGIKCDKTPCLTPGNDITVTVDYAVAIPGIPLLGAGPEVTRATAQYVTTIDHFREGPRL